MSVEYFTDEVIYISQAELTDVLNSKAREGRLVHIDRVLESTREAAWVVFERVVPKPRPSWERDPQQDPRPAARLAGWWLA